MHISGNSGTQIERLHHYLHRRRRRRRRRRHCDRVTYFVRRPVTGDNKHCLKYYNKVVVNKTR